VKLGGEVYMRLDMEDFLSPDNKEQQDLLILAWQALYDRHWSDPLGFYQLAAIHSNPVVPYDDSINEDIGLDVPSYPGPDCSKRSRAFSYCHHNSNLVLTWHRLHTALFEQRITQEAQAIAESYHMSFRADYVEAARALRLPAFDFGGTYAATSGFYPYLIDEMVTLSMAPDGTANVQVKNPIASYTFPITTGFDLTSQGNMADTPPEVRSPLIMAKGEESVRYPSEGNYLKTNITGAQATLKFVAETCIQPLLYEFFKTEFPSYNCISNEYDFETGCADFTRNSLERIHGFGHNSMGGNGLIGYPNGDGTLAQTGPLQAYEPIFFLLHSSMDKWLAMWQRLNPDMWIEESTDLFGTYTSLVNQRTDDSSPLAPFWLNKTSGEYITSADIRATSCLGMRTQISKMRHLQKT
jgi:tyrosinase